MSGKKSLIQIALTVGGVSVEAKGDSLEALKKELILTFYREQLKRADRVGKAVLDTAVLLNISERTVYNYLEAERREVVRQRSRANN